MLVCLSINLFVRRIADKKLSDKKLNCREPRAHGLLRYRDFKQRGPILAGEINLVAGCVVGDPVQHMLLRGTFGGGPELRGIDPTDDFTGLGRDAHDLILVPDVGPQFVFHNSSSFSWSTLFRPCLTLKRLTTLKVAGSMTRME